MTLAVIALLPIITVLVLMLGLGWPAVRAGAAGLGVALVLVLLVFPFDALDNDIVLGLAGSFAEAVFTTLTILWIILPALAIYRLQTATGAIDSLRSGLSELSHDPRLTAIVVAWFFALLLEGAAGFGTSAALAAPFLVAIGMTPVGAVTAAMLGHIVGVTFGAVGTPVVPMVSASGLEPTEISGSMALQAAAVGWSVPVIVAFLIAAAYPGSPARPRWQRVALGLGAALAFLVPFVAIAIFVGPELPTLAGALVGGALFILVIRRRQTAPGAEADASGGPADEPASADEPAAASDGMSLARAMAPYLILVGLVLATRLIGPLQEALRSVQISWASADGTFSGTFEPLYHPGTMLFIAFILGAVAQRASGTQARDAVVSAGRTLVPVAAALLAMLGLARLMVHSGMVDAIAKAAADAVGGAWPALAPAVGALGTFVTGSATASNALFSDLQVATATAVGHDVALVLGSQGLGAALGNAIAPHNLIAAAAIVALAGRESEILRRTLPVVVPLVLIAGVVALVFANL